MPTRLGLTPKRHVDAPLTQKHGHGHWCLAGLGFLHKGVAGQGEIGQQRCHEEDHQGQGDLTLNEEAQPSPGPFRLVTGRVPQTA